MQTEIPIYSDLHFYIQNYNFIFKIYKYIFRFHRIISCMALHTYIGRHYKKHCFLGGKKKRKEKQNSSGDLVFKYQNTWVWHTSKYSQFKE